MASTGTLVETGSVVCRSDRNGASGHGNRLRLTAVLAKEKVGFAAGCSGDGACKSTLDCGDGDAEK